MKQLTIEQISPFIDVDEEDMIMVGRNGELTSGFKIELPPIFTRDLVYFNDLHKIITDLISMLPNYCRLHKQDFFTFKEIEIPATTYIEQQRQRMFASKQMMCQDSYLYITLVPPQVHHASLLGNSSFNKRESGISEASVRKFKESVMSFKSQLESSMKNVYHFKIRQLYSVNYLGNEGVLAKYLYLNQPYYSDILFNQRTNDLRVGNNFVEIISLSDLADLPLTITPVKYFKTYSTDETRLHISMMAKLGPFFDFPHVLNSFIIKSDTEKEKKRLENKEVILDNFSTVSRDNRYANEDVNDFLEEQAKYSHEILDCHFNVMTYSEDPDTLLKRRMEIINGFKALNLNAKLEVLNKANLFFANMPGNSACIFKEMRFKTLAPVAACFLYLDNICKNERGKTKFQVVDRFLGTPQDLDISDAPFELGWIDNLNKFVLAGSGAGKSVLMNYYSKSNLESGAHVIIIDIGKSYEGLCDVFQGQFFEISSENSLSFNPFVLNQFDWNNGKLSLIKEQTLLNIIKTLWKGTNGTFTETETSTLERMIDSYYSTNPEHPCFDTFYEHVTNPELFPIKSEVDFSISDFKYVLEIYYKGGKQEHLLNARDQLNLLEYQLIVFELSGVKDSKLFPIITFVIMDTIMTKLNCLPGVRKEVLLDEAWRALTNNTQMEIFFQELIKTIRKSNGEAIFVSQELEDLISSPIIKNAIINNCGTKILLSQNQFRKRFGEIQSILGLTDHEKALIFSINKNKTDNSKDFFICYSNGPASVYTLKLSLVEYLICTSRQEEKAGIKQVARYLNGSYYDAIKFIVENLNDNIQKEIKKATDKGMKINYSKAVEIVLQNL